MNENQSSINEPIINLFLEDPVKRLVLHDVQTPPVAHPVDAERFLRVQPEPFPEVLGFVVQLVQLVLAPVRVLRQFLHHPEVFAIVTDRTQACVVFFKD